MMPLPLRSIRIVWLVLAVLTVSALGPLHAGESSVVLVPQPIIGVLDEELRKTDFRIVMVPYLSLHARHGMPYEAITQPNELLANAPDLAGRREANLLAAYGIRIDYDAKDHRLTLHLDEARLPDNQPIELRTAGRVALECIRRMPRWRELPEVEIVPPEGEAEDWSRIERQFAEHDHSRPFWARGSEVELPSKPASIKARAEAVITLQRNHTDSREELQAAVAEAFESIEADELRPSRLKTYDTRTLEVLFEAVAIASEQRPALVGSLENIFHECITRGFVGSMVERLYATFIRERRLDEARKLCERFPWDSCEIPEIVEKTYEKGMGPAVYEVSRDGEVLVHAPVDLTGPIIVSVVSPGCHFSREAVAEIEADPFLNEIFSRHAVNIEPATYRLNAHELAEANREGGFQYSILSRASAWEGFDFSSTPRFYFVVDGEIRHELVGFDRSDFREELEKGFEKIGLPPS